MCAMTVRTSRVRHRAGLAAGLAAVLAGALVVAGCSGQAGDQDADASTSQPSTTPSVSGSSVPDDGPLDRDQACAAMYVSGETPLEQRVGQALVDATEAFDASVAAEMNDLARDLGRLQERVPDEFVAPLEQVRVPFVQMQEHIDAGAGPSVELDVQPAVEGLKAYRALC